MVNISQLGAQGDITQTIISFVLLFAMLALYPRLLTTQTIFQLEKSAMILENLDARARNYILKSIPRGRRTKEDVRNFMEFFAVPPVDVDPYGLIKKLDHIVRNSDKRFTYFVKQIAPNFSNERQKNIKNALAGAITTHQIAKIVRHFLELVKKYKMFQLAMLLQMQIPLIERTAKASLKATEAFVDEVPIGDGIGPLVIANLIKGKPKVYEDEEFAVYKTRINGRTTWLTKASGPGATTGYPGKLLQKFFKRQRIDRIITIDAGLRMEGEKTGGVAEGVGVAMGGIGVDRYEIEEIAIKQNIPLDAIAIKVSDEEAMMVMKREIYNSVQKTIEVLKRNIDRGKKNERLLVMGVGNTCGVGNNYKSLANIEKRINENLKRLEREEKEEKKGFW